MFTDIEGSTRLARVLGEAYGTVLGAHRTLLRNALRDCGGVELFTEGDSFFVAFGDPSAAVSACVAAQRALADHEWPSPEVTPRVRMGLHTGRATPVGGEYASAEVHRAARVAAAAHGGQILCSQATATSTATAEPVLLQVGAPTNKAIPTTYPDQNSTMMTDLELIDLGTFRLRGFDDAERLFQIVAPGLERTFPRPRTPGVAAHNLPAAVTPFVGRQAEVAEVARLLGQHRLVTVAGPGGIGKTRIAMAAAERVLMAYPDGVWMVDCATASGDPTTAVAAALGSRREPGRSVLDTLVERCADRRLLIVLETVEAAPKAATTLARRLLAGCPRVDVLVTGRRPLGVRGELVWRVPPLLRADASALLTDRLATARGGRPADPAEGADLIRLAARLDGLPLAVELAAERLCLLSPAQLLARLDDPLTALDAGRPPPDGGDGDQTDTETVAGAEVDPAARHDSLTGNVDWSYRRLGEPAGALLRRLAVFAGPVDLTTVEWCGADALGALSELADNSLVEVVPGPRYQISAPIRGYAARRLAAAGEERAARDRHVAWSLHTLDGVTVDTDGQPRTVSLTALAPYVAEWHAALRWTATGGRVRDGLRLAVALDPWWREHDGRRTGRELLTRLYDRLDDEPPAEVAAAYLTHAGLAEDPEERTRYLDRAEPLAAGDPTLAVRALAGRRLGLVEAGRWEDAERLCRDVIVEAERTGVPGAALPAVVTLAELLWGRGALDEAAELLGGARQIEAGRPADRGRRTVDWLLGMVALRRRDLVAAHDHLVVALRSRLRHGFRGAAADAVAAIAVRCLSGDDAATAAVLFGGAESVRGARRIGQFAGFWAAQQAELRATLGDAVFDAAYAEGAEAGFDRIVAMALAVEHPDLERGSARFALR
jgi:predicted ATPase/class 3 adenylate cyclase